MLTEKTFDTGELTINYAERPASGPALVLLHGGTVRWQDWQIMIDQLAPTWHIYAPDLRGHGKSGRAGDHYLLNDFVRDIKAFLREVVAEPAIVMGHSLGALVGLGTAAADPNAVRGLVLLDPPLFIRDHSIGLMSYVKDWFELAYQLTTSEDAYTKIVETLRPFAEGKDESALRQRAETVNSLDPQMLDVLRKDKLIGGFDITQALERITCPTLIVRGEWDKGGAMRDEDAAYAKAHLRGVVIEQIPGADHAINDVHSAATLAYLTDFFQTVGM